MLISHGSASFSTDARGYESHRESGHQPQAPPPSSWEERSPPPGGWARAATVPARSNINTLKKKKVKPSPVHHTSTSKSKYSTLPSKSTIPILTEGLEESFFFFFFFFHSSFFISHDISHHDLSFTDAADELGIVASNPGASVLCVGREICPSGEGSRISHRH